MDKDNPTPMEQKGMEDAATMGNMFKELPQAPSFDELTNAGNMAVANFIEEHGEGSDLDQWHEGFMFVWMVVMMDQLARAQGYE